MTGYNLRFPSVGLAPGQILRLTLFNPAGSPVRAQAQIHHSGGVQFIFADGSVRFLQAGAFDSFDFKRSDISLPGEAGTGRLQLRATCYISKAEPWKEIDGLVVSMEIISISDGTSNTILVSEVIHPSTTGGAGKDILIGGYGSDMLMGIVPGQTLRVTIFNPPYSGSEAGSEAQRVPVSGHVKVFDGSGGLIAQSPDLVISPGESRSFDFNRSALPWPGEPGTGRLQLRAVPEVSFQRLNLVQFSVDISGEVIDDSTGKTTAGKTFLIFASGPNGYC